MVCCRQVKKEKKKKKRKNKGINEFDIPPWLREGGFTDLIEMDM